MAGFLNQAASSLFARSQIWSAYTAVPNAPDVQVGVWKVTPAKNSAGKLVSVLEYDKGSGAAARRNASTAVVDALKREVSTLTRMRHPCLLEVVERMLCIRSQYHSEGCRTQRSRRHGPLFCLPSSPSPAVFAMR
jgi:SCY1-like protein 2